MAIRQLTPSETRAAFPSRTWRWPAPMASLESGSSDSGCTQGQAGRQAGTGIAPNIAIQRQQAPAPQTASHALQRRHVQT
eukprot:1050771-Pelagomonas_calceolata.AAC.2